MLKTTLLFFGTVLLVSSGTSLKYQEIRVPHTVYGLDDDYKEPAIFRPSEDEAAITIPAPPTSIDTTEDHIAEASSNGYERVVRTERSLESLYNKLRIPVRTPARQKEKNDAVIVTYHGSERDGNQWQQIGNDEFDLPQKSVKTFAKQSSISEIKAISSENSSSEKQLQRQQVLVNIPSPPDMVSIDDNKYNIHRVYSKSSSKIETKDSRNIGIKIDAASAVAHSATKVQKSGVKKRERVELRHDRKSGKYQEKKEQSPVIAAPERSSSVSKSTKINDGKYVHESREKVSSSHNKEESIKSSKIEEQKKKESGVYIEPLRIPEPPSMVSIDKSKYGLSETLWKHPEEHSHIERKEEHEISKVSSQSGKYLERKEIAGKPSVHFGPYPALGVIDKSRYQVVKQSENTASKSESQHKRQDGRYHKLSDEIKSTSESHRQRQDGRYYDRKEEKRTQKSSAKPVIYIPDASSVLVIDKEAKSSASKSESHRERQDGRYYQRKERKRTSEVVERPVIPTPLTPSVISIDKSHSESLVSSSESLHKRQDGRYYERTGEIKSSEDVIRPVLPIPKAPSLISVDKTQYESNRKSESSVSVSELHRDRQDGRYYEKREKKRITEADVLVIPKAPSTISVESKESSVSKSERDDGKYHKIKEEYSNSGKIRSPPSVILTKEAQTTKRERDDGQYHERKEKVSVSSIERSKITEHSSLSGLEKSDLNIKEQGGRIEGQYYDKKDNSATEEAKKSLVFIPRPPSIASIDETIAQLSPEGRYTKMKQSGKEYTTKLSQEGRSDEHYIRKSEAPTTKPIEGSIYADYIHQKTSSGEAEDHRVVKKDAARVTGSSSASHDEERHSLEENKSSLLLLSEDSRISTKIYEERVASYMSLLTAKKIEVKDVPQKFLGSLLLMYLSKFDKKCPEVTVPKPSTAKLVEDVRDASLMSSGSNAVHITPPKPPVLQSIDLSQYDIKPATTPNSRDL